MTIAPAIAPTIALSIPIIISLVIRTLLAFILFRGALHKLRYFSDFCAQLGAYRLVPSLWVPNLARLLAAVEVTLTCSLPMPHRALPALSAAALLALYALAMMVNLWRGSTELDCGCGGPAAYRQTIGWPLVLRNGVLVLLALASALPVASSQLSLQDVGIIAAASIAVICIYASIELAITHRQRRHRFFTQKPIYAADAPG